MARYRLPDRLRGGHTRTIHATIRPDRPGDYISLPTGMAVSTATALLAGNKPGGSGAIQLNVVNYTDEPIYVLDRWNNIQLVPPIARDPNYNNGYTTCIAIEVTHQRASVPTYEADPMYKRYRDDNHLRTVNNNLISSSFYGDPLDEVSNQYCNQITQVIIPNAQDVIASHNGAFYMAEIGLVILNGQHDITYLHPDTPKDTIAELIPDAAENDSLCFELFINDNTYVYSRAYINVAGVVTEVPVLRSPKMDDGVFVRQNGGKRNGHSNQLLRYGLEDNNCPVVIFKSKSEAESYGQPDKLVDREVTKLKHETVVTKAKSELSAAQIKERDMVEEARVAELQRNEQRRAAEAQRIATENVKLRQQEEARRAAELDKAAFTRKMLVEGTKLITTVLTAAISVYAWFKLKSKST